MKDLFRQEESISSYKPQEFSKEQVAAEKKRVEEYKD